MKLKAKERKFFIALLITFSLLFVLGVVSFIYGIVTVINDGSFSNNVFETFYMGIHLIICAVLASLCVNALKRGSFVLKDLALVNGQYLSKGWRIIGFIFVILGFVPFIYFLLILFGVPLFNFNFPLMLILDLINAPLTLCVMGLALIIYPYVRLEKK